MKTKKILLGSTLLAAAALNFCAASANAATLTWAGTNDNRTWDYTSENWSGGDDGKFVSGDSATFDDTEESSEVSIEEAITAGTVTVTDSAYTFDFSDAGSLSATSLTINDDASLEITGFGTFAVSSSSVSYLSTISDEQTIIDKNTTFGDSVYAGYLDSSSGSITTFGTYKGDSNYDMQISDLTITDETTTFKCNVYVNGTLTINGGDTTFGGTYVVLRESWLMGLINIYESIKVGTVYVNGTLTITGGDTTFKRDVRVNGTLKITDGETTFKDEVHVNSNGTLKITDGETTFTDNVYVGGTLKITDGETTFKDDVYVGYNSGSSGSLTITGGTTTFKKEVYVGDVGTGSMEISGGTTTFKDYVYVGYEGTGELTITGGDVTFSRVYLGHASGVSGSLTITGGNVTFSRVYIGNITGSSGTIEITGGKTTFNDYVYVGDYGTGKLTIGSVDGTGGETTTSFGEKVYIGNHESASGTMEISGGTTTFKDYVYVGSDSGSSGSLTIAGGETTFSYYVHVGDYGNGTMEITGGTTIFEKDVNVGYHTGSTGSLTISDGETAFESDVYVGDSGTGELTITGGETTFSKYVYLGSDSGSSGSLTIAGGETTFSYYVHVGEYGTGSLTISGGTTTFEKDVNVAYRTGSTGSLTISDGETAFKSDVYVGDSGTGELTITGGETTFSKYVYIGCNSGSTGTMEISGGKTTFSGDESNEEYVYLGYYSNSSGSITISGGETTFSTRVYLGNNSSSSGTIEISGGTTKFNYDVRVGEYGTGELTITGGETTFKSVYIGYRSGATGTMEISGGKTTFSSSVFVGDYGTGELTVSDGETTFGGNVYLGYWSGSSGSLTITGGETTFKNYVYVGREGTGKLTISGGDVTFSSSVSVSAVSSLSLTGGTITLSEAISNSGTVTVNNDVVFVLDSLTASNNTYTLISGGTINGWTDLTKSNFQLNGKGLGRSTVDVGTAGQVTVTFVAAANLVWNGTTDSNVWTNDGKEIWLNDESPDAFIQNDNVTFADGDEDLTKYVTIVGAIEAGSVTVTGSGYTFTFSDNSSLYADSLTIDSGASLEINGAGTFTTGSSSASTIDGSLTIGSVDGTDNVTTTFSSYVYLGNTSGSSGELTISGNAKTTFLDDVYLGYYSGSSGKMEISGGETSFGGTVYVGYYGSGELKIGSADGTDGETTTFGSTVYVGYSGSGTLTIYGGTTTFEKNVYVGYSGSGSLTISGGETTFSSSVTVATRGSLSLYGGTITLSSAISNSGTVTVNNDVVFVLDNLESVDGTYTLISGGSITGWGSLSASNFQLNGINGSEFERSNINVETSGQVTIIYSAGYLIWNGTDTDHVWTNDGGKIWLNGGTYQDAFIQNDNVTFADVEGVTKKVTISGEVSAGSITVTGSGYTFTFSEDSSLTADTLTIDSGASLKITGAGTFTVSSASTIDGSLTIGSVDGTGGATIFNGDVYIGYSGSGSLTISDGGTIFEDTVYVGYSSTGSGSLTITGGVTIFEDTVYVGYNGGSGTMEITGGETTFGNTLYIGYSGSGSLSITAEEATFEKDIYVGCNEGGSGSLTITDNAATTFKDAVYIGYNSGSGELTITAEETTFEGKVYVGDSGSGTLTITAEETTFEDEVYLGNENGSSGSLTIGSLDGTSGETTFSSSVYLGYNSGSYGELTIYNGETSFGEVVYVGYEGTGSLTISGGETTFSGVEFGRYSTYTSGSGTMEITGGTTTFNGQVKIAYCNIASGTLKITGGTTTFNDQVQIGSTVFVGYNTGTGALTITGGTTTFLSSLSVKYNGTLNLSGGTITLSNAISNSGTVTVNNTVVFVLDNLTASSGNGTTYTLISGGTINGWDTLTESNFQLNGSGFGRSTVNVQTAGQVTIIANPADLIWNGTDGNSTWNTEVSSNWLNNGNSDMFYDKDNVIFGTNGTKSVSIAGTIEAGSVTVFGSGYTFTFSDNSSLYADTLTINSGASLEITGAGTFTTTVSSESTIDGSLTITGGGTTFEDTLYVGDSGSGSLTITGGETTFSSSVTVATGGSLSLSGGTITLSSAISNSGTVTVNNDVVFVLDSLGSDGSYTVITGEGTIDGWGSLTASNFLLDGKGLRRSTVDVTTIAGQVTINYVAAADLVWNGTTDSNVWTNNSKEIWINGDDADHFYSYDNVTFGAKGTKSVTIVGTVEAGSVTVTGSGYTFTFSDNSSLTADSLTINSGASLKITGSGTFTVSSPSTIDGSLTIGDATDNVTTTFGTSVYVGYSKGTKGTIEISGEETTFEGWVQIGYGSGSSGTLTISDNAKTTFAATVFVGYSEGTTGTIEISGGETTFESWVRIGYGSGSSGTLTISDNVTTTFKGEVSVAYSDASGSITIGSVDGIGGTTTFEDKVYVGYYGTGELKIYSGETTFGANVYVGNYGTGELTIYGGETTFEGYVSLGSYDNSSGSLTITGGETTFGSTVYVGDYGTGELTITVGETTFGSTVYVGNRGTGELTISAEETTFEGDVYVGNRGTGTLTIAPVDGTDGETTFSKDVYLGYYSGFSGTLTITTGETTFSGDYVYVGYSGTGELTISAEETTFDGDVYLGDNSGSSGSLTISAEETTFGGYVFVGNSGSGTLTITGGETTFENEVRVAYSSGSSGTLTITAEKTTFLNDVYLARGSDSYGTLTIYGEETTFGGYVFVGNVGTGSLTITGKETTFEKDVYLGYYGTGSLTIGDGTDNVKTTFEGKVYVGNSGTGSLTITGGETTFSSSVSLSEGSTLTLSGGTITLSEAISNSGTVTVGNNVVFALDNLAPSSGTYTIISGGEIENWDSLSESNFRLNGKGFGRSTVDIQTAGQVTINYVEAANLVWNGTSGDNVWTETRTEDNKIWLNGDDDDHFYSYDNVTFADVEGVTKEVTISGEITAGTVTVTDSSSYTFTFSEDSSITADTLTIDSGASLEITNGETTITTIEVSSEGTLKISGGTLNVGEIISNGSISFGDGLTVNPYKTSLSIDADITLSGTVTFNAEDDETIELRGTLSGSGKLVKDGDGTLTLSGDNTFSGGATISSGTIVAQSDAALGTGTVAIADGATLEIPTSREFTNATSGNGTLSIASGATVSFGSNVGVKNVNVASEATLSGSTTLTHSNAQLILAGTLALDASAGEQVSFTNGGTVILEDSATLTLSGISAVSPTGVKPLAADTEEIGPGSSITIFSGATIEGDIETFLKTDSTLSALADTYAVVYDPDKGLSVTVLESGNASSLTSGLKLHDGIGSDFISAVIRDEDLDFGIGFIDADELNPIVKALATGNISEASKMFDTLAPNDYAAMVAMPTTSFYNDVKAIDNRLAARRGPLDENARWEFFAQAQGTFIENDDANDTQTFDFDLYGILAGADYRVNEGLTVGVTVGYDYGKADIHNSGGKIESDDVRITLFAGQQIGEMFFVNAGAQVGYGHYEAKRKTALGDAKGDTDGWNAGLFADVGMMLTLSEELKIAARPYVGLAYLHSEVGSFDDNIFDVDDFHGDSLRASVGCGLFWGFDLAEAAWIVGLDASYSHDFCGDEVDIDATYMSTGKDFGITAKALSKDLFSVGPVVSVGLTKSIDIFAGYAFQAGTDSSIGHNLNAGLKVTF